MTRCAVKCAPRGRARTREVEDGDHPARAARARPRGAALVVATPAPELWASLAIVMLSLAVLFDAIFGPDIVTSSAGGDHSIAPSAVAVAFFAFLATWV